MLLLWVLGWGCACGKGGDKGVARGAVEGSRCGAKALGQPPLTGCVLQRIRATVNSQEQKRLLMDLDISMRTVDCPFTVTFYGALFREVSIPGTASSPRL